MALTTAACGLRNDGVGAGAGAAADGSYAPENAALYAPAGATLIEQNPGPPVTGPLTGQRLQLPYGKALPVPDGPIGDSNRTYTFCFSQALVNQPWPTAEKESLMLEAARHPNVEIRYFNTNDASEQVQHLRTCASQKVDGILVWPQSVGPLTPAIKDLCDKDMLVIGMERTVDTDCYTGWVFLDYKQAATGMAEAIAERIGGKGVVVETQGTPGSSPQILRHEGFVATMKEKYPDVQLVETSPTNFDKTSAYQAALNFLQSAQGQQIDAWYTQYGDIALGVLAAMQQTGRTDIPLFTIGDDKLTTAQIRQGAITAAVPATPLHADVALRMAILSIENKPFPKDVLLQQPALITEDNVAAYEQTNWGPAV
ncbi:sugar ABC transporter substrate-binding protein [Pseudonocardia sp. H11422]|uniref:sugar ABC transporter substrate-binding protein n=1 Tax=Pseudonocardia sp. H11422 TaxID=2835866 RepID=UPI001BDD4C1F|nr:substrate-binding domain-containing protein [Pseudonocardia sp. H11422]